VWLDSSEGAYIEKSAENKDATVCPAIMIPAGNGLITVALGRVGLRSKDVIVEDTDPLTAQEWEIIEAMGNLHEFSYDDCSATTLSKVRLGNGPPMELVVAISYFDKLSGEFITMNGIEQFRIPYKAELNDDGTIVPSETINMNKMVDLRTAHYFDFKTWTMRRNWSSGRYITWTRKTTRPFQMWPEAWNSEKIGLACDACRRAKALRAKHIRTLGKAENRIRKSRGPIPEKFGDQVTLDRIIARNERNRRFKGQTSALMLMDRATGFRWGRGLRQKTGKANLEVMRKFQGPDPDDKIKYV
jgi:hypothetical protein